MIAPVLIIAKVSPENTRNVMIVPKIPKSRMYPMFAKNLLLRMLNPLAKMIGGKQT